jgi:uncharacterized membrane protein
MTETNPHVRLEAFCDGVFAIALTLLIIDIKLPPTADFHSTADLWHALRHLLPSIFAFLLSFTIIFITWVNHHNNFKLVNKSSGPFTFANGFLMLTIVFIPFPTSLIGEYLLTDHAAPAVILYVGAMAIQAIGWILITGTALKNQLAKNEKATLRLRKNNRNGYFAFIIYTLLAILAFWFPLPIAIITTITWIFWLALGISMKHE